MCQIGLKSSQFFSLLLGRLALCDVDHRTHELNKIARLVEHRMAYAMNVPDAPVWINDPVVQFEIYLVADGFLESFPALILIVRMNPLNDGFYRRWGALTRGETEHSIALLRIVCV